MAAGKGIESLPRDILSQGLMAGAIWAVFLGGAATAIEAGFARPPAGREDADKSAEAGVPLSVGWVGTGSLLIGLVLSPVIHWRFFEVYLAGIVLLVIHSVPPIRIGRFLTGAVLLQAAALGGLTLYAGYTALGAPPVLGRGFCLYSAAFGFLFIGLRVILWRESSRLLPLLYLVCVVNGFVCLGMAEGYTGGALHTAVLGIALLGWGVPALFRFLGQSADDRAPSAVAALGVWLLTDASVAVFILTR